MPARNEHSVRRFGRFLHVVGAVAVTVSVVFAYYVVCKPLNAAARKNYREVTQLRRQLRRGVKIKADFEQLTKELETLKKRSHAVRARVPDQPNKAEFLGQLNSISREIGVTIDKYSEGSRIAAATSSYLLVNVEFKCDYISFCKLLDRIRRLKRMAFIESLKMTQTQPGMYDFKLSLLLYYGLKSSVEGKTK